MNREDSETAKGRPVAASIVAMDKADRASTESAVLGRYTMEPYVFGCIVGVGIVVVSLAPWSLVEVDNGTRMMLGALGLLALCSAVTQGLRVHKNRVAISVAGGDLKLCGGIWKTQRLTIPLDIVKRFRVAEVSEGEGYQAIGIDLVHGTTWSPPLPTEIVKRVDEGVLFYPGSGMTKESIPRLVARLNGVLTTQEPT